MSRPRVAARPDDRCLLVALLALCVATAVLSRPLVSLAGLPLGLAAVALAGAWRMLGRLIKAGLPFVLLMWVLTPLFGPGPRLEPLSWLSLSQSGLWTCALLTGKWAGLTLFMAALMTLLPPVRLAEAAQALGLPTPLVTVFGLSLRYVDTLSEELARTREAASLRGFQARLSATGVLDAGRLAASVFVRALFRAERVHEAMLLRGAGARSAQEDLPRPRPASLALAGVGLALGTAAVLLDRLLLA